MLFPGRDSLVRSVRHRFGDPIMVQVIPDASHALFPGQPQAMADAFAARMPEVPQRLVRHARHRHRQASACGMAHAA